MSLSLSLSGCHFHSYSSLSTLLAFMNLVEVHPARQTYPETSTGRVSLSQDLVAQHSAFSEAVCPVTGSRRYLLVCF